jgi:hypothetical protein
MGEEYATKYESVLKGGRRTIARVWPFPGVVVLDQVSIPNDEMTPEQAIELAGMLMKAAKDAKHLSFTDSDDILHDDRPLLTAVSDV